MRVFRQIVTVCMAFLWMPLTVHCGLEAAGLLGSLQSESCCDQGKACSHDSCATIEKGGYTASASSLKVPPPAQIDCDFAFCLSLVALAPPAEDSMWAVPDDRPHEWVSDWHIVRRAACPPRAPSLNA